MDPRLKLVSLLALLLTASLVRHPLTLAALYLLTLALAAASRLPTGFFLGRVWLFIPIFTGVVVIPSIFNVVRPGDPLLVLWDFGREVHLGPWSLGDTLAITRQGLYGAALLVLRVAVSVSLAVLLAVTTRWSELLKALRVFFVPRVFILILSMTYRYIHLLLGLATDMYMARRSRGGDGVRAAEERRFAAAGMGALLGKSRAMSDGIYSAMVSRGYDGEPLVLRRFTLSARDIWLGAGLIAAALLAAGGDRLLA
jgi:cobalt/nickel transport system permease protein